MNLAKIRQSVKPWMLPIAMLGGVLFHDFIDRIQFLAPYLIFVMLLITYCRVKPKEFKVTALSWGLLSVQIGAAIVSYIALAPFSIDLAQGTLICFLCPTATAAPVITGMLGGSVPRLATFSIISNVSVAILAPMLFSIIGSNGPEMTFIDGFLTIAAKVGPLIIAPLALAFLLLAAAPKVHHTIATHQSLSFYIWAVSLFIVVGRAVSFVLAEPADKIPEMIGLAVLSLAACLLQFAVGRKIGGACGDKIAGAQGLGQKNTVLAIWMSLTYLNPISSVAPAAYIAWQNTINSYQLYRKTRQIKSAGQNR